METREGAFIMSKRQKGIEKDRLLIDLVRANTNLTDSDIQILLEVSHSLPFISNLENGDVYINVLTKTGESVVVAQYRHPACDLYKRNIVGEIERKVDEPAVYRALEYGVSCRGLIGIIDEGRTMVRHTVSPIFNEKQMVIGSLTYEHPITDNSDTEPIHVRYPMGETHVYLDGQIVQDGLVIFDENGTCTFANVKAEEFYRGLGYREGIVGQRYEDLQLGNHPFSDVIMTTGVIRDEVRLGDYIFEITISATWENDVYKGIAVILQDKTKIRQMEDEITYRIASINEIHHRVKNNLQTIISLVGLEAAQTRDKEVKAFAKTIISRIRSINVTYDLLARTGANSVNLKAMLVRIMESSLESGNVSGCQISADVSGDELELTTSTASTVALIVNELLQNSLKYAFQGRDRGTIILTIEKGTDDSWITVSDDGCGFDEKSEKKQGSGLGLKLIDSLVKSKLKGQITISSGDGGTSTRFSFRSTAKK